MPEPLSAQQLLDLFRIAVDEYRFQVKLNWDRTAYLITLSSGLIAVATGLLKVGSAAAIDLFVAGVFFVGLFVSVVSIKNILTGHRYYRHTILKKKRYWKTSLALRSRSMSIQVARRSLSGPRSVKMNT